MDAAGRKLGIGVSGGQATGKVWVFEHQAGDAAEIDQQPVLDTHSEVQLLEKAVAYTDQKLFELESKVRTEQGEAVAQIFATHRMLMEDDAFTGEAYRRIQTARLSAKQAITQVAEETMQVFRQLEDEYFRERAADIQDILQQVLESLATVQGRRSHSAVFPAEGSYIVVAEELTPAQTVNLPKDRVLGFLMNKGGKTSHAAILARTYGIPAVILNSMSWDELKTMSAAQLDGDEGWVDFLTVERYDQLVLAAAATPETGHSYLQNETSILAAELTAITLAANIGGPTDLPLVEKFNAQGVGLYRTEFLFMGQQLPTEDEQVAAYRQVIAACKPHLTVIRTLDIGGDKQAPALHLPKEQNPFLGVRAIRLCLQKPEIFMTQLKALWRASTAGPTAVMFPMIATKEELIEAKQYLYQARDAVLQAGYQVGTIQVGIMIEIPAAALTAHSLAKEVDFFSIGTNDLTQYTLAVDRENSALADLGQHHHPAVLGLIAQVAAAAKDNGIWAGICGEAGGDTLLTPFFAALGIDELSMAPGQLPKVRKKLTTLSCDDQVKQAIIENTLACSTAAEVKTVLSGY